MKKKDEEGSSAGTTNNMMAMIMAKRNQIKKIGDRNPSMPISTKINSNTKPKPTINKPESNTKPSFPKASPLETSTLKKVPQNSINTNKPTKETKKPTIIKNSNVQKPKPNPSVNNHAKPPIKTGNNFAAKMAFLQARMAGGGGSSSSTSNSVSNNSNNKGPSKPIVELCEGNTKRIDINKIIGNLEKEKAKKQSSSLSKPVEVKVISGKGGGIPPPPPPPPPPPKLQ